MQAIEKIHLENEKIHAKVKKIDHSIKANLKEMKMQKKYGHKHQGIEKFTRENQILHREKQRLLKRIEKLTLKGKKLQAKIDKKNASHQEVDKSKSN